MSIEAQAMGLPVIGFNSGGFPETILDGKSGFVIEDRSDIIMSLKLIHLIEHKLEYAAMSKSAIEYSLNFDYQFTTMKYLELYKGLVDINC